MSVRAILSKPADLNTRRNRSFRDIFFAVLGIFLTARGGPMEDDQDVINMNAIRRRASRRVQRAVRKVENMIDVSPVIRPATP
jgi:hypothetical protein